jgi:hypothetical protein
MQSGTFDPILRQGNWRRVIWDFFNSILTRNIAYLRDCLVPRVMIKLWASLPMFIDYGSGHGMIRPY